MYTKCQAPLRFCVNILPISRNKVHCEMNYWCLMNLIMLSTEKLPTRPWKDGKYQACLYTCLWMQVQHIWLTIASKQSNGMYDDEYEQANDMCKVIKWCVSGEYKLSNNMQKALFFILFIIWHFSKNLTSPLLI